jgi:hypothetical protein
LNAVHAGIGGANGTVFSGLTRLLPSQWKSARITNAIERLHEELK